jgi:hypothetical protein
MEWETESMRRKGRPLGHGWMVLRYSMEKYRLKVEDTINREEWRKNTFQQKFLFVLFI